MPIYETQETKISYKNKTTTLLILVVNVAYNSLYSNYLKRSLFPPVGEALRKIQILI